MTALSRALVMGHLCAVVTLAARNYHMVRFLQHRQPACWLILSGHIPHDGDQARDLLQHACAGGHLRTGWYMLCMFVQLI
jgi:hypothetical protein